MTTPRVTLYFFEFVDNNAGRWSRTWAASKEAANTERQAKLDEGYDDTDHGDADGTYHQCTPVQDTDVDLTGAGVLGLVCSYATACDQS